MHCCVGQSIVVRCRAVYECGAERSRVDQCSSVKCRDGSAGQCGAVLCSRIQYSTVQYSTVQYITVQYSTVQYSTVQYSTVQYSALFILSPCEQLYWSKGSGLTFPSFTSLQFVRLQYLPLHRTHCSLLDYISIQYIPS